MGTKAADTRSHRRLEIAATAFVALFAWTMLASLWQGGWPAFFAFWKAYGIVALCAIALAAVYSHLQQGVLSFLGLLCVAFIPTWFWFAESWGERLWDVLAMVLAMGLTWLFAESKARLRKRGTRSTVDVRAEDAADKPGDGASTNSPADILVFTLAFWVIASISVSLRSNPLPSDPNRFAAITPERSLMPKRAARWRDLRIGLALSGGGYRAAAFHAGALQSLEALGLRVGNLSTVSGGSIIGAYYAGGGDPAAFADAVADGRFNLMRRLMQIQNALRLPFPIRVPGLGTELFPWASFDRLDVQRDLLQSLLFYEATAPAAAGSPDPGAGLPRLMIGATDLNYGFQIGLLPDGLLKLGHAGDWEVYRNDSLEIFGELDLANRVAISGAFPIAFPERSLKIRVSPIGATGRGSRELRLADGGIRDNSGYDLLRVAHHLSRAQTDAEEIAAYQMEHDWQLDLGLVSDAGALFGVLEDELSTLEMLPRMFDVAAIETDRPRPMRGCEKMVGSPLRVSPAEYLLPADRQFRLKRDDIRRASLPDPISIQFTPHHFPAPIVQAMIDLLDHPDGSNESKRNEAQQALNALLPEWDSRSGDRDWHRSYRDAYRLQRCDQGASGPLPANEPGACEAVRLHQIIKQVIASDIEVFRGASTLDDMPPPETVRAIERLGRMLVYLRWPLLSKRLDDAVACKAALPRDSEAAVPNP